MKNQVKKSLSLLLAIIMLLCALPIGGTNNIAFKASAADGIVTRLNNLRSKYPNGYYWNHKVTAYSNNGDELLKNGNEAFANSVTSSPCATHNGVASVGQYDCNYFDGGIQCYGFAGKVFFDVFGQRKSALNKVYNNNYGVQVGDYVRINNNGHSAVVLSKSGSNITVVECNLDKSGSKYNCMIRWDATYSINSITYYCHATNYDSIKNSTVSSSYFTSVSVNDIKNDTATITTTINLTYISAAGFYLGTSQSNMTKRHVESINKNTAKVWYDIKNECGIVLTHSTTYYYKFYIIVNSQEFQSEVKSFKTTGSHNYSSSSITKKPTCTASGVRTYYCSCGASYTETINVLDHNYMCDQITAATCTNEGVKKLTCTGCGDSYTKKIPALGHIDSNNDGKCDRCAVKTGTPTTPDTQNENCTHICHSGGLAGFIWKIIRIFCKIFKTNRSCTCGIAHY